MFITYGLRSPDVTKLDRRSPPPAHRSPATSTRTWSVLALQIVVALAYPDAMLPGSRIRAVIR
jgi:hypothetical protein